MTETLGTYFTTDYTYPDNLDLGTVLTEENYQRKIINEKNYPPSKVLESNKTKE